MENKPRLLIVEDEPLIRMALVDALEGAGYAVSESGSGDNAILQLQTVDFVAIITDIRLGVGLDGWEVARFSRQQRSHMAVVYMTGDSAADWASKGVPMSIMVPKPFAVAQIITAVSSLLVGADQF